MRPLGLYAFLWLGLLVSAGLQSAETSLYRLDAEVVPPVADATVSLFAVDAPYRAESRVRFGDFRFKRLPAGVYTIVVTDERWGETRRTVAVSESLADERGRVSIVFPLRRTSRERSRTIAEQSAVSVRELSVPGEARAELRRAAQALERRDSAAAVERLARAVEIAPDLVVAWNDLGSIANQQRRHADAERYFRRAREIAPDEFEPLVNLGGVLLAEGKYAEALLVNAEAVEMRPDDALAQAQLGINYFRIAEYGLALKHLIEAKRIDPGHFTHPQLFLAEIHELLGRRGLAIRELRDLATRYPDFEAGRRARRALEALEKVPALTAADGES